MLAQLQRYRLQHLHRDEFVAKISSISVDAINGIVTLEITNFDDLFIELYRGFLLQIKYKRVPIKINSHPNIDNKWRTQVLNTKDIFLNNRPRNSDLIYLKVPVYLFDEYKFQLSIKAKFCSNNLNPTHTETVNISSYFANYHYKIGDEVKHGSTTAKIVNFLDDQTIELQYAYQSIPARIPWKCSIHSIKPIIRTFYLLTNLMDQQEIERNVLIRRNDSQSINVWSVIKECVSTTSIYVEKYDRDYHGSATAVEHANQIITKNIFDFLFQPQFYYKVSCMFPGKNHTIDTKHHFGNLWQNNLQIVYNKEIYKIYSKADIIERLTSYYYLMDYQCYCCDLRLAPLEYAYFCYINTVERIICVNCISHIISLHGELKVVLDKCLKDILMDDCIQCITDFVIGGVSKIIKKGK